MKTGFREDEEMAKDPAFLFYPADWIGGTMGMTFEEKGAYMELLMLQFNRGHINEHMIGRTVGQLWENIKDKFIQDENGLWYNERLEFEKIKRANFTQSRRNNVSGQKKDSKKEDNDDVHMSTHMSTHMNEHMVNVNVNVNNNRKGGVGEKQNPEIIYAHQSEDFKAAFNEWIKYRKEKKQSLTKISMKKQATFLAEYSSDVAIKILDQSMQNGWTGLFPLKNVSNGNQLPFTSSKPGTSNARIEGLQALV